LFAPVLVEGGKEDVPSFYVARDDSAGLSKNEGLNQAGEGGAEGGREGVGEEEAVGNEVVDEGDDAAGGVDGEVCYVAAAGAVVAVAVIADVAASGVGLVGSGSSSGGEGKRTPTSGHSPLLLLLLLLLLQRVFFSIGSSSCSSVALAGGCLEEGEPSIEEAAFAVALVFHQIHEFTFKVHAKLEDFGVLLLMLLLLLLLLVLIAGWWWRGG
jgi:hypothetical protein